jgi:predicted amidohydrolase
LRSPEPLRSPTVAIAQTTARLGDLAANLERHVAIALEQVAQGADLVVFPELSLTGYFLKDLVPEVALRTDDALLAPLREVSRQADVVAGFVERDDQDRCYVASGYWSGGELLHVHRKVHLPTYGMFEDARFFDAGRSVRAFDTRWGRGGLLICEDLWHPMTASLLAADGATWLIGVSASPARGFASAEQPGSTLGYERLLGTYAHLWAMPIVYCNRVGFEDGFGYAGSSCLIDVTGQVVAEAPPFEEACLRGMLDLGHRLRARAANPIGRDMRLDVVERELRRILRDA